MTRCPVSVPVGAPLRRVAATLRERRISATPVVDDRGRPVGVLSEVDLMRAGLEQTAGEVMSNPVITATPDESLTTAARRLVGTGVRRLFVVEGGRLAGVLTRGDVLRGYLRDDDEIRAEVERVVLALLPGPRPVVRATVVDGVVLLLGRVEYRGELPGIERAVREVPGVVEVRDRMSFQWDDVGMRGAR